MLIVHVEDEKKFSGLLKSFIESNCGHTIIGFASAEGALEHFKSVGFPDPSHIR